MEDKEVGFLWHDVNVKNGHWQTVGDADAVIELIRKLVEERRDFYAKGFPPTTDDLNDALDDFGIPPETFHDTLTASKTVPR
jgi:hypothetical protein